MDSSWLKAIAISDFKIVAILESNHTGDIPKIIVDLEVRS